MDIDNIVTERLRLRQIRDTDIDAVYKGLSDPNVIRYYGISFTTLEDTRQQMKWYADLEHTNKGKWWAVCKKNTKKFIGAGGLNDWDPKNKKAEIGFWLLPEYWGQGYMKEGVEAICDKGFSMTDVNRIEAYVEGDNTNCIVALSRLAFQKEGVLRQYEKKKDQFIDICVYSLLRQDRESKD